MARYRSRSVAARNFWTATSCSPSVAWIRPTLTRILDESAIGCAPHRMSTTARWAPGGMDAHLEPFQRRGEVLGIVRLERRRPGFNLCFQRHANALGTMKRMARSVGRAGSAVKAKALCPPRRMAVGQSLLAPTVILGLPGRLPTAQSASTPRLDLRGDPPLGHRRPGPFARRPRQKRSRAPFSSPSPDRCTSAPAQARLAEIGQSLARTERPRYPSEGERIRRCPARRTAYHERCPVVEVEVELVGGAFASKHERGKRST